MRKDVHPDSMTQITEWDPHLRMPDTVARPFESSHRRPSFILNRLRLYLVLPAYETHLPSPTSDVRCPSSTVHVRCPETSNRLGLDGGRVTATGDPGRRTQDSPHAARQNPASHVHCPDHSTSWGWTTDCDRRPRTTDLGPRTPLVPSIRGMRGFMSPCEGSVSAGSGDSLLF